MKRAALTHPKMLDLASRLGISRSHAIGIITLLLDWTADYAVAGDIGKWPDGAIARACEWCGDATEFVAALVAAGWLDEDPTYRLLVHDWSDHCERWVKAKLEKDGKTFVQPTTEATVEATTEATAEASPPRDLALTSLNLPSLNKNTAHPKRRKTIRSDEFEAFWTHVHKKVAPARAAVHYESTVGALRDRGVIDPHAFLLDRWKLYQQSDRGQSEFAWEPCAWLRDGHYDDDPETWKDKRGKHGLDSRNQRIEGNPPAGYGTLRPPG